LPYYSQRLLELGLSLVEEARCEPPESTEADNKIKYAKALFNELLIASVKKS
jgi:hypothetical protein